MDALEGNFDDVSGSAADTGVPTSQSGDIEKRTLNVSSVDESRTKAYLESIFSQSDELKEEERFAEAKEKLLEALAATGENADLLLRLAEVEDSLDEDDAAISHMARANELSPDNPAILSAYADLLSRLGLLRQALSLIKELPDEISADPSLREVLGDIYVENGWHALAVDAYGPSQDLTPAAQWSRRRSWRRSGGPAGFIRSWIRKFNERMVSTWEMFSRSVPLLDTLGLSNDVTRWLQRQMDDYLRTWARLSETGRFITDLASRCSLILIAPLSWAIIFAIVHGTRPHVPFKTVAIIAVISTLIGCLAGLALNVISRFVDSLRRSFIAESVFGIMFLAAGILLISETSRFPAWPSAAGIGLIAAPFIAAFRPAILNLIRYFEYSAVRRLRSLQPREAILDTLLDALEDVSDVEERRDFDARGYLIRDLEFAARIMEQDLWSVFRSGDGATDAFISDRARGAAAAIRRTNRHIAIPGNGTWDRVERTLRSDIIALASGDLAGLRWVKPPIVEPEPKRIWKTTLITLRTIAVMLLPIAAVVILQPVLKFGTDTFTWVRVASLGWALLYFLITIDPTLANKVATFRDAADVMRGGKRPSEGSGD